MIYVLTADLQTVYELDDVQSLILEAYYNSVGSASVVALATPYVCSVLRVDRILYQTPTKQAYVIRRVVTDDSAGTVTADCYSADELLNQRIINGTETVSTVEADVLGIVSDNLRGLTKIDVATASGLTETHATQVTGGSILDGITPILDAVSLGRKMTFNAATRRLTFSVYKGADRTTGSGRVLFSKDNGSLRTLKIDDDTSMLKNVAYVAGEGEGAARIVEVVGTETGDARREVWIDARDLKQEDGELEVDYRARLAARGVEKLTEYIQRLSIEAEIDADELGTAYNLGDLVACRSVDYGISFNARIKGVRREEDKNGVRTSLILGEPQITVLGAMKIWLKQ